MANRRDYPPQSRITPESPVLRGFFVSDMCLDQCGFRLGPALRWLPDQVALKRTVTDSHCGTAARWRRIQVLFSSNEGVTQRDYRGTSAVAKRYPGKIDRRYRCFPAHAPRNSGCAKPSGANAGVIAVERLTHIRERIKAGKRVRTRLHRWGWAQLQNFVQYKARGRGACRDVRESGLEFAHLCRLRTAGDTSWAHPALYVWKPGACGCQRGIQSGQVGGDRRPRQGRRKSSRCGRRSG